MKLDNSQQKIVNAEEDKICVIAGAGSGKTSTLINRVAKLLKDGVDPRTMVCITFTRMAAQEMRSRLQNIPGCHDMFIGTIHSYARQIYTRHGNTCKLLSPEQEQGLIKNLIKEYAKKLTVSRYHEWCIADSMVRNGKMKRQERENILTTEEEAERRILSDESDMSDLIESATLTNEEKAHQILLREVIANTSKEYPETVKSRSVKEGYITFNAMLEKSRELILQEKLPVEYLFVDEFQDIGLFEYRFLKGLNASHVFVVGDDYQCQPAGTMVEMFNGNTMPIEQLKIGDAVTTYHNSQYLRYTEHFKDRYAARIQDISVHSATHLYEVSTANRSYVSRYTYNHRCYTSLRLAGNEKMTMLYMLKNEKGWYRIGVANVFYSKQNKFALPVIMQKEKAVAGWILDAYPSRSRAKQVLYSCMKTYELEKLSWIPKKYSDNSNIIQLRYSSLGDQTLQAAQCLKEFNRSISCPFRKGGDDRHFTHHWMFEVEACNLVSKLMDVFIPDGHRHKRCRIENIKVLKGEFTVYGLDVSKYHNYIADRILTHNSIYGFRGADFEYFKAISNNPEFKTYKLTNNYRCNRKIVNYSNQVINTIDDVIPKRCVSKTTDIGGGIIKDTGGIMTVCKYAKLIDKRDYKKWFFLTRNNDDLVTITRMLYRNNIPYTTFKKGAMTQEQMLQSLELNTIKVLTIHSAKGLEADNVLMYGDFPDVNSLDDSFIQNHGTEHIRIMYVGITRARNNLIIINHPGKVS